MSAVVRPSSPRKRLLGRTFSFEEAWQAASTELGVDMVWNDFHAGPTVRGFIDQHRVNVALVGTTSKRRKPSVRTTYTVDYQTLGAPTFSLTKRFSANGRMVDTGNPDFDKLVSVATDEPARFGKFMTETRRAAILTLLKDWPLAKISKNEVTISTEGAETSAENLVLTVSQLLTLAKELDRLTAADVEIPPPNVIALGDVPLNERQVLDSLFNSNLDTRLIAARFEQLYRGHQVSWSGEVLTVGARYGAGKQVAVLIGSADSNNPDSGRVVALTTVSAESPIDKGDLLSFTGSLLNLDPRRRLFRIE